MVWTELLILVNDASWDLGLLVVFVSGTLYIHQVSFVTNPPKGEIVDARHSSSWLCHQSATGGDCRCKVWLGLGD